MSKYLTKHWRLNVITDGCLSLIPKDLRYFDGKFMGNSMIESWKGPPEFQVAGKTKKANDFVAWFMAAPIVSERTRFLIEDKKAVRAEFLDFGFIKKNKYFALNILDIYDCVDMKKSEIFFSYGDARGVPRRIVFNGNVPDKAGMFKARHIESCIFISDWFARNLIAAKTSGFSLTFPATDVIQRLMVGGAINDYPGL